MKREDLKKIFEAGEKLGLTYSTWFTPTDEDREISFKVALNEFMCSCNNSDYLSKKDNLIRVYVDFLNEHLKNDLEQYLSVKDYTRAALVDLKIKLFEQFIIDLKNL